MLTAPKNRKAIAAAMAQAGISSRTDLSPRRLGRLMARAPSAGQAATHSTQPVHSMERIVMSLSTGRAAGQALAHFAQSMQGSGERRMRAGPKKAASPKRAP